VWKSEFSDVWQQWVCLHVCSLVYTHRPLKVQLIVHYEYGFLITLYYVSCILHDSQSPSFLSSIIVITSSGRYNLRSYKLCSFLQYPITFNHKILWTDQLCSQTLSVFPQCHRPNVTDTTIKILRKQTHVYTSIASFVEAKRITKHSKAAVCISTN